MSTAPDLPQVISQRLDTFLSTQRRDARNWGDEASLLVEAGAAAVTGGKRLRARFCITGWRAVAAAAAPVESIPAPVLSSAAALEVFHAAALVHDDIIDNSDTRRGRPAAHRSLEARHVAAGWSGDPAAFGRSGAVLLGDLLVAWSDDLLEEGLAATTPDRAARTRSEYATMRREVTVGQFLDVAEESAWTTEPDRTHAARALRVAEMKSARYSILQPLLIGAALAGADEQQTSALAAFGTPVGLAFQLRDDVLGVFGDTEQTGKPSGDDLREGKRTVLVAYARESLDPGARRLMDELLGDPGLDDAQIAALQRTIIDSGALDRVEALISDWADQADRALRGVRLDNAAVGQLRDLARAATVRVM
ncbi:polyprenyl synthetase family protein [Microbacterium sp. SSW1-59]|uniref:polyprenyl synthetase family protein n=1 Tax=Microbacterium xanthum TaxID=3079794 RepID=UPI002AD21BB8|nr:polyprenyl synthetase family protein [Microbacterium sp. SSW1-59]MDZ8202653.1 polyprenyl synthetase family protein [Microbacterium sp. SSW1-59]